MPYWSELVYIGSCEGLGMSHGHFDSGGFSSSISITFLGCCAGVTEHGLNPCAPVEHSSNQRVCCRTGTVHLHMIIFTLTLQCLRVLSLSWWSSFPCRLWQVFYWYRNFQVNEMQDEWPCRMFTTKQTKKPNSWKLIIALCYTKLGRLVTFVLQVYILKKNKSLLNSLSLVPLL